MSRKIWLAKSAERNLKRAHKKFLKAMQACMIDGMEKNGTDYRNLSQADDLTYKAIGRVSEVIDS